jgi:hypothetical protein
MRSEHFIEQALPLARARFSRCATIAANVARSERIGVARNVAPDVASNVDNEKHRHVARCVAPEIERFVAFAKRDCALNVASTIASMLRWPFTNLLTLPLTAL